MSPNDLRAAIRAEFEAAMVAETWGQPWDETAAIERVIALFRVVEAEAEVRAAQDAYEASLPDDDGLLPISDTYGLLRELSAAATQGRWFERYGLIHGPSGGIFFGDDGEQQANARLAAYSVNAVRRALASSPVAPTEDPTPLPRLFPKKWV